MTPPRPRAATAPSTRSQQAARVAPAGSSSGRSWRHRSNTCGQRGWNAQPAGSAVSRGIVPSICVSRSRSSTIDGIEPISPTVYGCCGRWITSATGPISTMRPAYITATRSAVSAITPMSCVTSITAVRWSRHSRFSSWMICAWIDTSSAVVGSSATMSLGLVDSASAMTTRCRMPPENWCG